MIQNLEMQNKHTAPVLSLGLITGLSVILWDVTADEQTPIVCVIILVFVLSLRRVFP